MADPLFDITGKIALITGGTSGIGRMIAEGFVARGVKTYITGREQTRAAAAAREICAGGGECIGFAANMSLANAPEQLIGALMERESRLDILVNNAGADNSAPIEMLHETGWDHVLATNLRAPFFLVQQTLPLLRAATGEQPGPVVINLGSIGGLHIPNWEAHAYGASKAAIHHLTRSLAKRLGKEGIRVNAIAPGPFPSNMTDTNSDAVKKSVATYVPLGRPGAAPDIQGVCIFLASRAGAYIHGSTIALDGGYIAAL